MRNHTGVRPYMCKTCNKGFAFISDLRTHEQCHLPDSAKPHKCHICSRGYSTQWKLNSHLKGHSGERPYECEYEGCYKAFASSGQRTRHHHTHTGTKNYKCPKCDRAFSQPGNLKRHVRNHSGLTPYRCIVCDYRSAEKGNLKRHVKYKHPPDFTEANLAIMLKPIDDDDIIDKASENGNQNATCAVENEAEIDKTDKGSAEMEASIQESVKDPSVLQSNTEQKIESETSCISKYLPSLNMDKPNNIVRGFTDDKVSPVMSGNANISNDLAPLSADFDLQNENITDLNSNQVQVLPTSLVSVGESENIALLNPDAPTVVPNSASNIAESPESIVNTDVEHDSMVENDLLDSNKIPDIMEREGINPDLPVLSGPHLSQSDTSVSLCRNVGSESDTDVLRVVSKHNATIQQAPAVVNASTVSKHTINDNAPSDNSERESCSDVNVTNMSSAVLDDVEMASDNSHGLSLMQDSNSNITKKIAFPVTFTNTSARRGFPMTYNLTKKRIRYISLVRAPAIANNRISSQQVELNDNLRRVENWVDFRTITPVKNSEISSESLCEQDGNSKGAQVAGVSSERRGIDGEGIGFNQSQPSGDDDLQDKINAIISRNTAVLESVGIKKNVPSNVI